MSKRKVPRHKEIILACRLCGGASEKTCTCKKQLFIPMTRTQAMILVINYTFEVEHPELLAGITE